MEKVRFGIVGGGNMGTGHADKFFNNKKFWLSLLINLFMVTASCFALNWIHPRVNKMIENKRAEKAANNQKVEVA